MTKSRQLVAREIAEFLGLAMDLNRRPRWSVQEAAAIIETLMPWQCNEAIYEHEALANQATTFGPPVPVLAALGRLRDVLGCPGGLAVLMTAAAGEIERLRALPVFERGES